MKKLCKSRTISILALLTLALPVVSPSPSQSLVPQAYATSNLTTFINTTTPFLGAWPHAGSKMYFDEDDPDWYIRITAHSQTHPVDDSYTEDVIDSFDYILAHYLDPDGRDTTSNLTNFYASKGEITLGMRCAGDWSMKEARVFDIFNTILMLFMHHGVVSMSASIGCDDYANEKIGDVDVFLSLGTMV